jgi:hypothetical protein
MLEEVYRLAIEQGGKGGWRMEGGARRQGDKETRGRGEGMAFTET